MAFNLTQAALRRATPKPLSPAEKAVEESSLAYRRYSKLRTVEREALFASSPDGELLRKFAATLNHFRGSENEPRMIEYVREQNHSWLRNAPDKFRVEALRLISERCIRNSIREGRPPLNDPLPGQPDDTFRICKRELGL